MTQLHVPGQLKFFSRLSAHQNGKCRGEKGRIFIIIVIFDFSCGAMIETAHDVVTIEN